jgi:hypothetical protein
MEKKGRYSDGPIYDEVIVSHRNRLQLKFRDCFGKVTYKFKSVFTLEVFLLEFSKVLKYNLFPVKHKGNKKNIFFVLHPTPKGPCGGFWSPPDAQLF